MFVTVFKTTQHYIQKTVILLDFLMCTFLFLQGFGGKFGVQRDRVDKSAHDFNEQPEKVGTNYEKLKPDIGEFEAPLIVVLCAKLHKCIELCFYSPMLLNGTLLS